MEVQPETAARYRFGATDVDPGHREVIHDGQRVNVGDRAFDLLLLLIEQRGTVLSKDHIMQVVWPRRIIGENTLEAQVSLLRRALHRDRDMVRTIAGRGYQFVGDVSVVSSPVSNSGSTGRPARNSPSALRPRGLPAHVSRLIGRNRQLSEVMKLVLSRRCVTLVGAGGVGKTRLAIEAARQLLPDFADGIVLIELAATSSAEYLPATVAAAFGFPLGDGTPDLEKLAPSLRDRRLLIVVDNCEHLVESAAQLVETLLQVTPASTVVATSREALRIAGEHVYRVPSLDMPVLDDAPDAERFGAIELFLERAAAGTDAENAPCLALIVRICRQLDGIPLAIELAAARTAAFGIHGVADRLDDRFQMLKNGSRTALPRQQTLRATVDWGYALLPPGLQTVLARLSLFSGVFTLDSARRMIAGGDLSEHEVTTAIGELVEKSLLCAVPSLPHVHYRLLETIRAYARDRLVESGTSREWLARHAQHMLDVFRTAEKFATERAEIDWNRTFGLYLDDLRAAVDWGFSSDATTAIAVELSVVSIASSMQFSLIEECLRRIEGALRAFPTLAANGASVPLVEWEMKLHAGRGACLLFQSVGAQTGEAFATALALAEQAGDCEYQLRGLWGCWSHAYLNGKYAEALALASRFADVAAQSRWPGDRMVARRISGISHLCLGQLNEALDELEHIQMPDCRANRAERIRFLYDERSMTQSILAQALAFLGRFDEAAMTAQQALDAARALGHTASICYALSEALCPTALLRDDNDGLEHAVHALADATRRHGVSTWKARAEMWGGLLTLRAGQVESYDASIAPSLDEIGDAQHCVVLTAFLAETATALARHGKKAEAAALLDRAIAKATCIHDTFSWVELLRAKADVMLEQPDADEVSRAETMLVQALRVAQHRGYIAWEARCERSLERLRNITVKSLTGPEQPEAALPKPFEPIVVPHATPFRANDAAV
ncbi:ATP-binding protein [Paraburkholderia caffeinilytica]|uniref:ATP-binding protein n=1 Tax=Paraburkholderia caffeinilytica TaxID=1761016 RepID=UPI0038B7D715